MNRFSSFLIVIGTFLNLGQAQNNFNLKTVPEIHQQVIIVTTNGWNEITGTMKRFEKLNGDWVSIGDPVDVVVGKNGMAWGCGVHKNPVLGNEKKEGDGKAPAGAFNLSTAFGYMDNLKFEQGFPYRQATDRDYYVDDVTLGSQFLSMNRMNQ